MYIFFFSSRRRHTRYWRDWSSDVCSSDLPRYLEPFAPERIVSVKPGDKRMVTDPDVVRAEPGVLKVRGTNVCGRGVEGSGFVFHQDRLMTNAHVVAGVRDPEVVVGDETVDATVVFYDPELDIAVLSMDTGSAPVLPFNPPTSPAQPKESVAILGYPEDGPFHIAAARIRSQQRLSSPDIYGENEGSVIREVFAVRGDVRPGNSGGPLLDSTGQVVGVVFAASVTDRDTGYALTAAQVADSAAAGITSTTERSTGDCAG